MIMSSKRKLEEQKRKEEEERLAAAQKEFVESFSDAPKLDKAWVKAGTVADEKKGLTICTFRLNIYMYLQ